MIQKIHIERFGALADRQYDFSPGLNVLLGPNEAGKSTIAAFLHSMFFQTVKLSRSRARDKSFLARYLPYPGGEWAGGRMELLSHRDPDERILFSKGWSIGNPSCEWKESKGVFLNSPEKAEEKIKEWLYFPEGTYQKIFFAAQEDYQQIFAHIQEDGEAQASLSGLLKMATVELAGLPPQAYLDRLDEILRGLISRWDFQTGGPEGRRGIENPFSKDVGEILKEYYKKEELSKIIGEGQALEKLIAEKNRRFMDLEEEYQEVANWVGKAEALEKDALTWNRVRQELLRLDTEMKVLQTVSLEWPKMEEEKRWRQKASHENQEKLREYGEMRRQAIILKILASLVPLMKSRSSLAEVSLDSLDTLRTLSLEVEKEALQETSLGVSLKVASAGSSVTIRQVSGDSAILKQEEVSFFPGKVVLTHEELELEIQALPQERWEKNREIVMKQEFLKALALLGVSSIKEAEGILFRKRELDREIGGLLAELPSSLQAGSEKDLETELEHLREKGILPEKEITRLEKMIQEQEAKNQVDLVIAEKTLANWEEQFEKPEKVLEELLMKMESRRSLEKEKATLQELPDSYTSVEDFLAVLRDKRAAKETLLQARYALQAEILELARKLPEESLEELEQEKNQATEKFRLALKKAERLREIRRIFQETFEEVTNTSTSPLEARFGEYISRITGSNYQAGAFGDNWDFTLEGGGKTLPVSLLSAGTREGVALAFRLAVLHELNQEHPAISLLDDCLVNMDPKRQEAAMELIRQQGKKGQILFTTCNPQIAQALGGHLIHVE